MESNPKQGETMKKFLFSLIACFAWMQSGHAITSTLNQSINIYEAILSAVSTGDVISQNEFIIDVERKTRGIDLGNSILYQITTVLPDLESSSAVAKFDPPGSDEDFNADEYTAHHHRHRHRHHNRKTIKYAAVISVTPNPAIGPPVVTVISITPVSHHAESFMPNLASR